MRVDLELGTLVVDVAILEQLDLRAKRVGEPEQLRAAASEQERMRAKATMDKLRTLFVRSSPTESEASLLRGSLEALMNPDKKKSNKS